MTKVDLSRWQERWVNQDTPWDLNGPHPLLIRLLSLASAQGGLKDGSRFYSPGCGRAHDGAYLARHGYPTTASDFVSEAISAARKIYPTVENLTLEVGDAFDVPKAEVAAFDAVFDRAMFCAIPPARRRDFVKACAQRLKSGGLFLSIPFLEVVYGEKGEGPPFAISIDEMIKTMAPEFGLVTVEEHINPDSTSRIKAEMVTVWMKQGV